MYSKTACCETWLICGFIEILYPVGSHLHCCFQQMTSAAVVDISSELKHSLLEGGRMLTPVT